jgi:hypothetical protein
MPPSTLLKLISGSSGTSTNLVHYPIHLGLHLISMQKLIIASANTECWAGSAPLFFSLSQALPRLK